MCGIIAIVRRRATRPVPDAGVVQSLVEDATTILVGASGYRPPLSQQGATLVEDAADVVVEVADGGGEVGLAGALAAAADRLHEAGSLLGGVPGVRCLLGFEDLVAGVENSIETAVAAVEAIEKQLDVEESVASGGLEHLNKELVRVRDALWSIGHDRLGAVHAVRGLLNSAGMDSAAPPTAAVEAYLSIHQALGALDRLEVRGRDSAGLHLLITGHGLDPADSAIATEFASRGSDPSFGSGSARLVDGVLSVVYKQAAEIGELGDNTAALRTAIRGDALLAAALQGEDASVMVLGHTRWASVGIISEANAHPLNSELVDEDNPYVVAAVNGDVDNYADLVSTAGVRLPAEITTDSKTIPSLMSRRLREGLPAREAFRRTVDACEGSVAVATCTADDPDRLLLALRGSGQALYVGFADDAYVVASEPYGVVEETGSYLRMDGETVGNPDNPNASRGQTVELDAALAGTLEGVTRQSYDGTVLAISPADVLTAAITTRDIDRGDHPHYLLKEIGQAPASFRKTLRGRVFESADGVTLHLSDEAIPQRIRSALRDGSISRVLAIGQGTAAVAGESLALCLRTLLRDAGCDAALDVTALPATELSAFHLRADMSDTLVVAISQSGTTTDTNRTVDLVRDRGGAVVGVVNRRDSDLTERVDGVLYTSDGRDVEMSVASTKAFYSQVAAGCLLAAAIAAEVAGGRMPDCARRLLEALRTVPEALEAVLARRDVIAEAARRLALSRRHWAVVGNGPNQVAAREVRIKLSELCYMSISSDVTEDKKHIDLSSEPLVFVCAAGLSGSTADDVAKEVAIFAAHRAAPVVVADDGDTRFDAAGAVLAVPVLDPRLAFVAATMVGHLFGYEAALAVDAGAGPLRESRAAVESAAARSQITAEQVLSETRPVLERSNAVFSAGLRRGDYDGHLEASTAVRISAALRYAIGRTPLDSYELEFGVLGTPTAVIDELVAALSLGIDELTRPIDAIRHQAKTVTVGISRSDQTLLEATLTRAVLEAGAPRDHLTYSTLRTLANLAPAVAEVLGHTRYRVDGLSSATVLSQSGISEGLTSRVATSGALSGSKHRVAAERSVLTARGRHDGRTVVFVPEVAAGETTAITLLHVRFEPSLSAAAARGVLQGYRNRYWELRDAVTETEPDFDEALLAQIPTVDLLTKPPSNLADHWRHP